MKKEVDGRKKSIVVSSALRTRILCVCVCVIPSKPKAIQLTHNEKLNSIKHRNTCMKGDKEEICRIPTTTV